MTFFLNGNRVTKMNLEAVFIRAFAKREMIQGMVPGITVSRAMILLFCSFVCLTRPLSVSAANSSPEFRPDRILVMPKADGDKAALSNFHLTQKAAVVTSFKDIGGLQVLAVPDGETVPDLIAKYQQSGLIAYAEPDYLRHLSGTTPNDPFFTSQKLWGLHNTGQLINNAAGTPDADIDAPEAWDLLTSASNIVVAVLDTGVRYTHQDLASNMWVNPVGGGHGTNAVAGTTDPNDDNRHGSLVAGVIGAVGNNSLGVVGVAWQVQIMACKCFDGGGGTSDSLIISCIDFARTNGARIINGSFDGSGFSLSLSNAIYSTREAGMIYVASCGNGPPSVNVDSSPVYPACYGIDNIVSVAYTDRNDGLGFLSNYGATNVDLAAPGAQIYSTSNASDSSYYPPFDFINVEGTSYAAPFVAGTCALLMARYPADTHQQIIKRLLDGTDPLPSLNGKCVTGGRLNLRKALSSPIQLRTVSLAGTLPFQLQVATNPNRSFVIEASTNLVNWSPIVTNTTSASGTFDYIDSGSSGPTGRYFRAVSTP